MSPNSSSATFAEPEKNGEAISFLGETFFRPEDDEATFLHKDSLLQEANTIYQTDTTDLNSIIWYGRRLASMYRFRDAITIFSAGIRYHQDAPELYRHRGQMYIITRRLDLAIVDLTKASALATDRMIEIEPDAIPNKLDLPQTNLRFNIYYQLGLAWYLKGDYKRAIDAFASAHPFAINPDLSVAESYWVYHSFLRLGKQSAADSVLNTFSPYTEIFENEAYLKALFMYKMVTWEGIDITLTNTDSLINSIDLFGISRSHADSLSNSIELYGISNWIMMHDRKKEASSIRKRILGSGNWIDIGYIAAETDSSGLLVQ